MPAPKALGFIKGSMNAAKSGKAGGILATGTAMAGATVGGLIGAGAYYAQNEREIDQGSSLSFMGVGAAIGGVVGGSAAMFGYGMMRSKFGGPIKPPGKVSMKSGGGVRKPTPADFGAGTLPMDYSAQLAAFPETMKRWQVQNAQTRSQGRIKKGAPFANKLLRDKGTSTMKSNQSILEAKAYKEDTLKKRGKKAFGGPSFFSEDDMVALGKMRDASNQTKFNENVRRRST